MCIGMLALSSSQFGPERTQAVPKMRRRLADQAKFRFGTVSLGGAPALLSLPLQNVPSGLRVLQEARAGRDARDIGAAGGIFRQPVETIDQAQHIRHENVGYGKASCQPFASRQDRLHVLEPVLVEESVKELPSGCVAGIAGKDKQRPRQARHLHGIECREQPLSRLAATMRIGRQQ